MASSLSSLFGTSDRDVGRQIASLTKQIYALQKSASNRGSALGEEGWDVGANLYGELLDRFSEALPQLRKKARSVEASARDNPGVTAAVVGVVVVGLAVALFSRR
ncbi:hypothetical protein GA830_12875 [Mesorhizobium sp. NBSH29]|uniref:hypothetical protein n=1 Tax=Mesorhizobium sp. NBSH29 TaxID=2654249 RepID=UPI001896820B|nr:hypothetical protein [Mesorhizobium sp. NBSH29]QPC87542.1 hypothetical protein GA830_12875 [Mesorhizobium sp. NBSH29]